MVGFSFLLNDEQYQAELSWKLTFHGFTGHISQALVITDLLQR
jgi:hypothetical protein